MLVGKLLHEATEITIVFRYTVCVLVNMIEDVRTTEDFQKGHLSLNKWNEVVSK